MSDAVKVRSLEESRFTWELHQVVSFDGFVCERIVRK